MQVPRAYPQAYFTHPHLSLIENLLVNAAERVSSLPAPLTSSRPVKDFVTPSSCKSNSVIQLFVALAPLISSHVCQCMNNLVKS